MKTINIVLAVLFILPSLTSQRGTNTNPYIGVNGGNSECIKYISCSIEKESPIVIEKGLTSQSGTIGGFKSELAVDDDPATFASSAKGANPFWETEFISERTVKKVNICFKLDTNVGNVESIGNESSKGTESEFYVFTSPKPFRSKGLADVLTDPCVDYVKLEDYSNCSTIELGGVSSKYLRVQSALFGKIKITDIGIVACGIEKCDSELDEDGDGKIGCEDDDCQPNISNIVVEESSLQCNDGKIKIQTYSHVRPVRMSVNGGEFVECGQNLQCILEDLEAGDYEIVIDNGLCPQTINVTVPIQERGSGGSLCDNGNFEEGSFDGWLLEKGKRGSNSWDIKSSDDCPDEFSIETSGVYSDPYVPGAQPLISPAGNEFIAILGEPSFIGGSEKFRMTKCFEVTEENANFCFSYAMILEDPSHIPASRNPYFRYEIYLEDNPSPPIERETIRSDEDDHFQVTGDISAQGLNCVNFDLSSHIGEQVCIRFTLAECSKGGHGAYAIIEGICQECSEQGPNCDFQIAESVCMGQDFDIGFSVTNNIEEYSVQICDGGICTDPELIQGYLIEDLNLEEFVQESEVVLECDKEYEVKLNLFNGCGSCSETKTFLYVCSPMDLDYDDCIVTCSMNTDFFEIPGSVDCENCDIQWQPSGNLYNSNTANPIFKTDVITKTMLFNREYTVFVTNEYGCSSQETISIYSDPLISIDYEIDEFHCSYEINGIITLGNDDFPIDKITLNALEMITGSEISIDLHDHDDDHDHDERTLPFTLSVNKHEGTRVKLIASVEPNCSNIDECTKSVELPYVPPTNYTAKWRVWMPNIFSPNSIHPENRVLHPYFSSGTISVDGECEFQREYTSVYKYELLVYDRWGDLVFEGYEEDETGRGLIGGEFSWDGTFNGSMVQPGVFTVTVKVWSCYGGDFETDCGSACYHQSYLHCQPAYTDYDYVSFAVTLAN